MDKRMEFLLAGYKLFFMDDDIDDEYFFNKSITQQQGTRTVLKSFNRNRPMRSYPVRIQRYYESVIPAYSVTDFQAHFRIRRSSVEKLLGVIGHESNSFGRPSVPIKKQLLICLWVLGNQECLRSVADRFGNGKSTIRNCVFFICNSLIARIHQFIKFSGIKEMVETEVFFRENCTKFPGVIGCIDGTHIPILKPSVNGDSYINRKGYPSIHLQAVCNHKREFIHVYCGLPGSVHDARSFRISDLPELLESIPENMHLLGDSAYPLLPSLITPYRDNGHLTDLQKKFNYLHSKGRIIIEHSFGILKQKFRCLKGLNLLKTELIPKIVLACCILHNVSIDDDPDIEFMEEEWLDSEVGDLHCNESTSIGEEKRNYLLSIV